MSMLSTLCLHVRRALCVGAVTLLIAVAPAWAQVCEGDLFHTTQTFDLSSQPLRAAVNETTNTVYLINPDDDTVTVIDGSTGAVTAAITVGDGPRAVAVNETTNTVYVANLGDGTVTVIDGSDLSTQTIAVVDDPYGVTVNETTNTVYVTSYSEGTLTVIDGSTGIVTETIDVGLNSGSNVAVNETTNTVYVPSRSNFDATLTVIDGSTGTPIDTITVASSVFKSVIDVTINETTNTVYARVRDSISISEEGYVAVIDGSNGTLTDTYEMGDFPIDVVVGEEGNTVYVLAGIQIGFLFAYQASFVQTVDGSTGTLADSVFVQGGWATGLALNETTSTLYVTSFGYTTNLRAITFFCGIEETIEDTEALVETIDALALPDGLNTAFVQKLQNAAADLEADNLDDALAKLMAFINQVEAQRGKKLTDEEADTLVAAAEALIAQIEAVAPAPDPAPDPAQADAGAPALETASATPDRYALEGNYPNPFNPATTIRYALPESAPVRLAVYDVSGREVAVLVERTQGAGRYEASFRAEALPSGVYLYRLTAGSFAATGRMLLLK